MSIDNISRRPTRLIIVANLPNRALTFIKRDGQIDVCTSQGDERVDDSGENYHEHDGASNEVWQNNFARAQSVVFGLGQNGKIRHIAKLTFAKEFVYILSTSRSQWRRKCSI